MTPSTRWAGPGRAARVAGALIVPAIVLSAAAAGGGRVALETPAQHGGFFAFAFSPDGATVAGGTGAVTSGMAGSRQVSGGEVVLWNAQTGQLMKTLGSHGAGVTWVAYAADGKTLASGSKDNGTLKVWDLPQGRLRHVFAVRTMLANSSGGFQPLCALTPDGRTLVAASARKVSMGKHTAEATASLAAWDAVSGRMLWSLPNSNLSCIALSPDGRTLAGYSAKVTWKAAGASFTGTYSDRRLRLWDVRTGKVTKTLAEGAVLQVFPTALAFRGNGSSLALLDNSGMSILDLATGKVRPGFRWDSQHWAFSNFAFSRDGKLLARVWSDYVEVLDARTGRVRGRETFAFPEMLFHAAFSADLKRMACTLQDPVVVDVPAGLR